MPWRGRGIEGRVAGTAARPPDREHQRRMLRVGGIETFDDTAEQIAWSHHWIEVDGRLVRHSAPYRYVWPSELDLMARAAGLRRHARWAGWSEEPFTTDSTRHVTVYEKAR